MSDRVKHQTRPVLERERVFPMPVVDAPAIEGQFIAADESIKLARILNPFDPRELTRSEAQYSPELCLDALVPDALAHTEWIVSVNGHVVERERWNVYTLNPGDYVVLSPIPAGDSFGNIFRIIAMIAVAVLAPVAAGWLGAAMGGFWATGIGIGLLTAGITLAGTMLVNALLPIKPVEPKLGNGMDDSSPTYGIDGPKNVSLEGVAVPVCYGVHRMAGNIIELYVENVDDTQMLYMLINAGEGPVYSIDGIQLNDQDIDTYKNVEWTTRLGLDQQEIIPWFVDAFTARNLGIKLDAHQGWTSYTTPGECDRLRFDFVCPNGLYKVKKEDGSLESNEVSLTIQYRLVGTTEWTTLADTSTVVDQNPTSTETPVTDQPNPGTGEPPDSDGGTPGMEGGSSPSGGGGKLNNQLKTKEAQQNPTYSANTTISAKNRSAVRRSFSTPLLTYGRYEIQIKRNSDESTDSYVSDQVFISDINEITSAGVAYNHSALVGIKIKLTDQLNGVPNITYVNHGRIVNVWDESSKSWGFGNSSNPAFVVIDMLIHWRYGGQLDPARMDLEAFKDWAHYCNANNLQFNGVFDSKATTWDQLQYVCRLGHAQLVNIGTRWSVAIERADTPVMMFGVGNIVKGSFKLNWLPVAERANEVEVTYFDRTDGYKQKTIKVYDPALLTNGRPQRTAQITLFGCTDELTAVKEGMLALNLNKYVLQTAELETSIDALACTVGSLVYVQHDMPDWAASGRLAAGSGTNFVELDREVTLDPAKTNKLLLLIDQAIIASGTIASIDYDNNYLTLNGYDGSIPCKHIIVGNDERSARPATVAGQVYVESVAGWTAGQQYFLYASDIVYEVSVNNATTGSAPTTRVYTVEPVPNPPEFTTFMVGPVDRVKRPFRVKAISAGSDDLKRTLQLIQYDERAYTIDTSVWNGPGNNPTPGDTGYALSHVTDLQVYEEVFISGSLVKDMVVLTWSPPQYGVYKGADVWVSVNDEPLHLVDSIVGANTFKMDADVGSTVRFKVVAFDMWDKRLPLDSAPEITYKVTGVSTTPPVPPPITGLDLIWQGRDCKIFWRINSSTSSYEFGSEPYGADSGFTDPNFQDYEVRVYHDTSPTSPTNPRWEYVRTEYVTAPSYIYTFEKNSADGVNRHLKFEVRVRVRVGPPGAIASVTAYNPPPYIPQLFNKEPSFETCEVFYPKPTDLDFEGVMMWLSTENPPPTTPENLIYDGPNTSVFVNRLESETDYFVIAAGYDTFGKIGLQYTNPLQFHTGKLDVTELAKNIIGVDWLDPTLQARIDLIDGDMPGSVNARILGEALARGAAVTSESVARQSADESIASKTDLVTAAVAGVGAAAVQQAVLAQITQQGGIAQIQDALAVQVGNNHSAILNEQTVRASADTALAQQITTLTATVNGKNRTFYQNTAPVSDASYTLTVGDIWIDTAHGNLRYIWNGTSWVPAADAGQANRIFAAAIQFPPQSSSSYTLQVGDLWIVNNSTNPSDPNNGRIFTWNGSAWIETPNAQVAANTASLNVLQQTVAGPTGLTAQFVVRTDINGYVAGFGLASQQTLYTYPDGHTGWRFTSEFEVLADKFSIRLPSYPNLYPFTVGTVNGQPRVVINVPAVIGDLTVQTLHLVNGAITMSNQGSDFNVRGMGSNYTPTYFQNFTNSHTATVPFMFAIGVTYQGGLLDSNNPNPSRTIDVMVQVDGGVIWETSFDASSVSQGQQTSFSFPAFANVGPGTHGLTVSVRENGTLLNWGTTRKTTAFYQGNKK